MNFRCACPACGSTETEALLDLPDTPVFVGAPWPTAMAAQTCPRAEIRLQFCRGCGLIYNGTFDPSRLDYSGEYDNSLHFSATIRDFTADLARGLIDRYGIHGKRVVEIGCGWGDFLRQVCELGQNQGIGFDPSCRAEGAAGKEWSVRFVRDYYGPVHADCPADLIVCRHVFEHVEDPRGFLRDLRRTIGDRAETVLYFEVPDVRTILQDLAIGTIIYEHCLYFGAESLARVFRACGFEVLRLESYCQGEFLGIEARPAKATADSKTAGSMTPGEDLAALTRLVASFRERYAQKRAEWQKTLDGLKAAGKCVVAWGGGARTVTLFNMLGIGGEVPYVVDINPRKRGTHLAGTGQPIVGAERLREVRPDAVLVMNSLYEDEIRVAVEGMGLIADLICM